jgi:DNA-binding transcriptional LysR family regulator
MLNKIDLSRVDLNLLALFEVVLEERHVGRAADRLHLSPSAVSHGLGRLRRLLHDPLFLKTPKGVACTARTMELATPIAEVLARARNIISTAQPFDARTSRRRFTIGAPDGVSSVVLPSLLARLRDAAPGVDVSVRQLLPVHGEVAPDRAWRLAFAELEARAMDIAIIPAEQIPARFHARTLYEEEFVLAMRAGHSYAENPTVKRYCEVQHLVVSLNGDPHGFVDEVLAQRGYKRRVALTVPNFMAALAMLSETDLISALPRRFAAMHAHRFGLVVLPAPMPLMRSRLNAIAPKVAILDSGIAWLFGVLEQHEADATPRSAKKPSRRRR